MGVEAAPQGEALRHGERHGGVVGPLPRFEAEGAAAGHLAVVVPHRGDTGLELQGGAEGLTDCEAEHDAAGALDDAGLPRFRVGRGLLGSRLRGTESLP